jgi:hypothetical protein
MQETLTNYRGLLAQRPELKELQDRVRATIGNKE